MYSFKAKFLAVLITANLIIFGAILTPLSLADQGISVDAELGGLRDAVENGELDCSRDCENNSGNSNGNGNSQDRRHPDLPEVTGNDINVNDNSGSQSSSNGDDNESTPTRRHATLPTVRGNDIHVSYSLAGLREYVQNSQANNNGNNGNQGNQGSQDQPTPTPNPPVPQQSASENNASVNNNSNNGATYSGDNQVITNNIYNETNIYNNNTTNNYGYAQAPQSNQIYGQTGLNYTFYEVTSYRGVPTYVYYLPQTIYSPIYQPILQRIVQTTYWY